MNWEEIFKYIGYISVVVAGIKGLQYLFSITPTGKLKEQVKANTTHLEKDLRHLERIDDRLDIFEKRLEEIDHKREQEMQRINKSLDMIGKSMTSIINHMIDGNNIEKMKEKRDELTSFFMTRD